MRAIFAIIIFLLIFSFMFSFFTIMLAIIALALVVGSITLTKGNKVHRINGLIPAIVRGSFHEVYTLKHRNA